MMHPATQPTHVLLSFCNSPSGNPSLGLFDIASGAVEILEVPDAVDAEDPRGISVTSDYVFLATGRSRAGGHAGRDVSYASKLFTFDRRDLSLISTYATTRVVDVHSILATAQHVDVVSTGTDSVVRLDLDGPAVISESRLWRPEPGAPDTDEHHLNAIAAWGDEIVVSGFGRKTGATWSTARNGFVVSLTTGERLAEGLLHPHSLLADGDRLLYCESSSSSVRILGGDAACRLPGYPRGLCRAGEKLFAASSRGRRISRSTGGLTNRGEPGIPDGTCGLARLDGATLALESFVPLNVFGHEIYEAVAVAGVGDWPRVPSEVWRERAIIGMRTAFDERDQTIAWLHTEVAARDTDIRWLHGEVAERDTTIGWLHGEIAKRDGVIEALAPPDPPTETET